MMMLGLLYDQILNIYESFQKAPSMRLLYILCSINLIEFFRFK